MRPDVIRKARDGFRVAPNLLDYEDERRRFSWASVRAELAGAPGGGLNIGVAAVDRHLATSARDRVAFRFLGRGDRVRAMTYAELARASGAEPRWNFHKYLVDRGGRQVLSFDTKVAPGDAKLVAAIERLLEAR